MSVVPQGQNSVIFFLCFLWHGCLSSVLLTGPWLSTHDLTLIFVNMFEIILRKFYSRQELSLLLSNPVAKPELKAFQAPSKCMDQFGSQSQPVYFTADPRFNNIMCSFISIFLGRKSRLLPTHSLPPGNLMGGKRFPPLELAKLHPVSYPWLFTESTYLTIRLKNSVK